MAHIRRYFEQALAENRQMAEHALKEIRLLYRIEHDCDQKQLTENERMRKRQELAGPIMDALKLWMETEGIKYSPNSLTGKAITYAYTRWENMMRYLQDGRIHIDNIAVRLNSTTIKIVCSTADFPRSSIFFSFPSPPNQKVMDLEVTPRRISTPFPSPFQDY